MKKLIILLAFLKLALAQINNEFADLFTLANEIRGSNYECDGSEMYVPYAEFKTQLENDYLASELESIQDYEQKLEYFNYWKYQSFDNFNKFKRFGKLAESACKKDFEHFLLLSDDKTSAKKLCERFIQRFGERAFGAIKPPYRKLDDKYKRFLELETNDAISYLSMSDFDELELEFLLKIALLEHKDLSIIRFLLQSGAPIDRGYESALFFSLDYPAAMRLLLASGADANYTNSFNKTALIYAIERNDMQAVQTLLRFGARVDIALLAPINRLPFYLKDCAFKHSGKTALMSAASSADIAMLKLLIDSGANVFEQDAQGLSALDYALIYEREENAKFLRSFKEQE